MNIFINRIFFARLITNLFLAFYNAVISISINDINYLVFKIKQI